MSAFDAIFNLLRDASQGIVGLLGNDAFFIVLILVLLVLLFKSILSIGLSFLPVFSESHNRRLYDDSDAKRKKMIQSISWLLAILMSIGVLGVGSAMPGQQHYTFSIGNIRENAMRFASLMGVIGAWSISVLLGGLVFSSLYKNSRKAENKPTIIFDVGMMLFSMGLTLAVMDSLRSSEESLGLGLVVFSLFLLIPGVISLIKHDDTLEEISKKHEKGDIKSIEDEIKNLDAEEDAVGDILEDVDSADKKLETDFEHARAREILLQLKERMDEENVYELSVALQNVFSALNNGDIENAKKMISATKHLEEKRIKFHALKKIDKRLFRDFAHSIKDLDEIKKKLTHLDELKKTHTSPEALVIIAEIDKINERMTHLDSYLRNFEDITRELILLQKQEEDLRIKSHIEDLSVETDRAVVAKIMNLEITRVKIVNHIKNQVAALIEDTNGFANLLPDVREALDINFEKLESLFEKEESELKKKKAAEDLQKEAEEKKAKEEKAKEEKSSEETHDNNKTESGDKESDSPSDNHDVTDEDLGDSLLIDRSEAVSILKSISKEQRKTMNDLIVVNALLADTQSKVDKLLPDGQSTSSIVKSKSGDSWGDVNPLNLDEATENKIVELLGKWHNQFNELELLTKNVDEATLAAFRKINKKARRILEVSDPNQPLKVNLQFKMGNKRAFLNDLTHKLGFETHEE